MARYRFDNAFERKFVDVCQEAQSMAGAAVTLGMNYKTLCFHAKRLNCFKTNQAGKAVKKVPDKKAVNIVSIFDGTYSTYQTSKIRRRLINEGYKLHKCEQCGLSEWMSKPIPLELHHKNGIRTDHSFENLSLLCPNCHAFTDNYRAKNIRKLGAQLETAEVEPLKFGETLSEVKQIGNPEPNPSVSD